MKDDFSLRVFFLLIACTSLCWHFGCSKQEETPRERFEIFVQALKVGNQSKVQESVEAESFKLLISNVAQQGNDSSQWIRHLGTQTREGNPRFKNLQWLVRNQVARIYYLTSNGGGDSLVLVKSAGQWRVRLNPEAEPIGGELGEYQIPKSRQ